MARSGSVPLSMKQLPRGRIQGEDRMWVSYFASQVNKILPRTIEPQQNWVCWFFSSALALKSHHFWGSRNSFPCELVWGIPPDFISTCCWAQWLNFSRWVFFLRASFSRFGMDHRQQGSSLWGARYPQSVPLNYLPKWELTIQTLLPLS